MISREFFENREQKLSEYQAKGCIALDEFLQQTGVTAQQFLDAGLLQLKKINKTPIV